MNRFHRTELLLGRAALERLRGATVLVAGLGAVGSYAVEGLARAGVGHLRLVDFDVLRPSNINRQLYALESTLGRPKVEVAAERVRDIHPGCIVDAQRVFVDADTAPAVLAGPPDAVVDAIDSFAPKAALLRAAVAAGVFVVSSMGAATRTDPGAIRVGDLSATEACPLARRLRKQLRRQGVERGIRCVYSVEPPRTTARPLPPDAGADAPEEETLRRGRPRAPLGSLSCLTGIFGLTAANEVILHLARTPAPSGR